MNNPGSRAYTRCLACRALRGPQLWRIRTSRSSPETEVFCFLQKSGYGSQLRRLPPIDTAHIEFAIVPAPL